jgi:hypothetical protein
MRLGKFDFEMGVGSFRRITGCWSGPGWDFSFGGVCVNDNREEPAFTLDGEVGIYCEAAKLPFEKMDDYAGVMCDLPGYYDEASGEPYFAVQLWESYELLDAKLRFAARDGDRYLIELTGTVSEAVLGQQERLELLAWAKELPDHSYLPK